MCIRDSYVGKPNPVMMRSALNNIGAHSENTVMIGDRMDTDVKAGLEAGMRTVLVRSGISDDADQVALGAIAGVTGGTYHQATDEQQLQQAFLEGLSTVDR